MKKLLFLFLLGIALDAYSQCTINPVTISSHTLGNIPAMHIPAGVESTFNFSVQFASASNRTVEVNFGTIINFSFSTAQYTAVNVNGATVVTFNLTNLPQATLSTFSITGTIDCGVCDGSSFDVRLTNFENINQPCIVTQRYTVWNRSLPWMVQRFSSIQQPNTVRGSVVRYHVTASNNNTCFGRANANRTIEIIDEIPAGAVFQQAFIMPSNANIPVNLPTRTVGPNQVGISLIPGVSNEFYVDILYPCNFSGTTATNRLSYIDETTVPCAHRSLVQANDLTLTINQSALTNGGMGTVVKTLGAPGSTINYNPGGNIAFEIVFTNTGTVPLRNIEITDIFPTGITGTQAGFQGRATAATQVGNPLTLSANVNNQWQTISNFATITASGFRLTLNPNHTLLPFESIRFWVYGTTDANAYDATIMNNAQANYVPVYPNCINGGNQNGSGDNGPGTPALSASDTGTVRLNGREPRIRIAKLVCQKPCYQVGEEIQFQLHVINEGNANLDPAGINITDILPPNLTFIGGSERYYLFPFNMTQPHPSFVDCNGNNQYSNYELINPRDISSNNRNGATTLQWNITNPLTPNPSLPNPVPVTYTLVSNRIIITFRCRVTNTVLPNNVGHNNQVSTNRDSIVAGINTMYAIYYMCQKDELTAEKLVSVDGNVFTNQVSAPAGATVRYQIRLTNTGNMPLTQIRIADDMPHIGDRRLGFFNGQTCIPRNSQFEIRAVHTQPLMVGTMSYFANHNPCVSSLFTYTGASVPPCCGITQPTTTVASPTTQGFFIDLGGMVLLPGDVWTYEFDGVLPAGLNNGATACNSISFRASRANSAIVLEFGETNTACVTIENRPNSTGCEPCKNIEVTPINGRLTPQRSADGIAYQLLQNNIRVAAPGSNFNRIRINVISYQFETEFNECLIADAYAFNDVGVNGDIFQQVKPSVMIQGQPTSPYNNAQFVNQQTSEVTWHHNQPFDLSNATNIPVSFYLPMFSQLPCCKVKANICVRITFLNDECEVCERIVCFTTDRIDEDQVKCNCTRENIFDMKYEVKRKTNIKRFPTRVSCLSEVKLPAGLPISMSHTNLCNGDATCEANFEWKLIATSTGMVVNSGRGNSINYTLPTVGETYTLLINSYCGTTACESECKINIKAVR